MIRLQSAVHALVYRLLEVQLLPKEGHVRLRSIARLPAAPGRGGLGVPRGSLVVLVQDTRE
eukprot:7116010-Pyramimonas_sp.AAC.1